MQDVANRGINQKVKHMMLDKKYSQCGYMSHAGENRKSSHVPGGVVASKHAH